MKSPSKDDILTALALIILLFSAMITWTIRSLIILVAIRHCLVFQKIKKYSGVIPGPDKFFQSTGQ